ncbi:MAG: putative NOP5 family protein [Candidatus Thorarchaeota archaeon]|nr:MAG: putative NOP5 family protein [Candidatus Thorarchaeota archaeon]
MPIYIEIVSTGLFALDKKSNIVAKLQFYPDVELATDMIRAMKEGNAVENIDDFIDQISTMEIDGIVVENTMLARVLGKHIDSEIQVQEYCEPIKWFRVNLNDYMRKENADLNLDHLQDFRRDVAFGIAKSAVSTASQEKDLLIKQAIDGVSELDKSINVLTMRLREWYSIHHPTLSDLIEEQEIFVKILQSCGGRDNITIDCLREMGLTEKIVQETMKRLKYDIGADIEKTDLEAVLALSKSVEGLLDTRAYLEEYITNIMDNVAPNISTMVGPMIGARLISLAGSLKELARKPSSTIQILGAEKALFRALKTGADPPKHGIIYRVPEINTAPYWQRGKVARALAGKVSLGAKVDAYSDKRIGEKLREEFLARVAEIQRQNPNPPKPKPIKKKSSTQRRKGRDRKRRKGGRRR